jgi:predicted RNA-binding protein with PIN domain
LTRWIVDAMNVIGSRPDGWWRDRHAAMERLVGRLELWAGEHADDVTVVFERAPEPPIVSERIEIAHAPAARANAADDEIVRIVGAADDPQAITVATSDRRLAGRVRAIGAAVEPASAFRRRLEAAEPGA